MDQNPLPFPCTDSKTPDTPKLWVFDDRNGRGYLRDVKGGRAVCFVVSHQSFFMKKW
jgi:hypothetical protein